MIFGFPIHGVHQTGRPAGVRCRRSRATTAMPATLPPPPSVAARAGGFQSSLFGNLGNPGNSSTVHPDRPSPFDTHARPFKISRLFPVAAPVGCLAHFQSRSGGIGRRAWFRSMYPQGCGGSSPFFGTNSLDPTSYSRATGYSYRYSGSAPILSIWPSGAGNEGQH